MTRKYSLFVEDILDAIVWIEQFADSGTFEHLIQSIRTLCFV